MCCNRRGSACTAMLHVKTKLISSADEHNPKRTGCYLIDAKKSKITEAQAITFCFFIC